MKIASALLLLAAGLAAGCADRTSTAGSEAAAPAAASSQEQSVTMAATETSHTPGNAGKITRTDEEWRKLLTPEQFRVLRQKGTERAFTGEYASTKEPGVYLCAACGQALFESDTKFDSGTGWPSFFRPTTPGAVDEHSDTAYGMVRTEVVCSRCGGHLGHVFPDGPRPTGLRYCINSVSLKHVPKGAVPATQPAD